ncbi:MAG: hypothetical protein ABI596_17340 [Pyrinomonadaceae bacterium]
MIFALALSLIATTGGALATYLYDEDAPLASRLCSGACIGFAALGLIGFITASFLGLGPASLLLSAIVAGSPYALLINKQRRAEVRNDIAGTARQARRALLHPDGWTIIYVLFYAVVVVVMWFAFTRAMFERPDGIYTGVLNNYGDLPFHLSVITRFAFGQNFPPEDPTYSGARFTYPFITDFVSAMFTRAGASLSASMFIENFILGVALVGVVHRWAMQLLRDRLAAIITPVLILLNGGLGWWMFLKEARQSEAGFTAMLARLPHSYTIIPETSLRWGNAVTSLLVPQRGFLLGIPLAVIVFTQWWAASEVREKREEGKKEKGKSKKVKGKAKQVMLPEPARSTTSFPLSLFAWPLSPPAKRMLAAGLVAGLLPLVHAHTFVVVMGVGGILMLATYARAWAAAGIAALALVLLWAGLAYGYLPPTMVAVAFGVIVLTLAIAILYFLPEAHRALWLTFFLAATVIALPQLWWSTHGSAVSAGTFFGWQFGWDSADEAFFSSRLISNGLLHNNPTVQAGLGRFLDVCWFWFKNTGVFIPLLVAAFLWQRAGRLVSRRLLLFYLPFTLCFIIPNLFKMAPWIWDNVKVLFYWWVAAAPIVALLLARLWQRGIPERILAGCLFVALTLAGGLDVYALVTSQGEYREFDRDGIQFAQMVREQTPQHATILHAPIHNHPIFLTGRRSLMGYPGHIWTHGLEFAPRQTDIRQIYSGGPQAARLMARHGVEYVVISPLELSASAVDESFFSRYTKIGEVGGYRLYKIKP